MKKFYLPALIAVFITGCSSASTVSNVETNAAKSNAANIANVPSNVPPATNQAVVLPSNNQPNSLPPPANITNQPNANLPQIQGTAISRENFDRLKSKGFGDKNAPPIPSVKPTPNTAPDNSEIVSTMNTKGVPIETRTFKNNSTLLKIEKTFEDLSHPITKVYLKNGKVLTVPKDAIANPETAPGDEILRAVGVKP